MASTTTKTIGEGILLHTTRVGEGLETIFIYTVEVKQDKEVRFTIDFRGSKNVAILHAKTNRPKSIKKKKGGWGFSSWFSSSGKAEDANSDFIDDPLVENNVDCPKFQRTEVARVGIVPSKDGNGGGFWELKCKFKWVETVIERVSGKDGGGGDGVEAKEDEGEKEEDEEEGEDAGPLASRSHKRHRSRYRRNKDPVPLRAAATSVLNFTSLFTAFAMDGRVIEIDSSGMRGVATSSTAISSTAVRSSDGATYAVERDLLLLLDQDTGQLAKVAQLFIFGKDGKKVKVGSAFRGLCFSPSGARNSISLYVVALRGTLAKACPDVKGDAVCQVNPTTGELTVLHDSKRADVISLAVAPVGFFYLWCFRGGLQRMDMLSGAVTAIKSADGTDSTDIGPLVRDIVVEVTTGNLYGVHESLWRIETAPAIAPLEMTMTEVVCMPTMCNHIVWAGKGAAAKEAMPLQSALATTPLMRIESSASDDTPMIAPEHLVPKGPPPPGQETYPASPVRKNSGSALHALSPGGSRSNSVDSKSIPAAVDTTLDDVAERLRSDSTYPIGRIPLTQSYNRVYVKKDDGSGRRGSWSNARDVVASGGGGSAVSAAATAAAAAASAESGDPQVEELLAKVGLSAYAPTFAAEGLDLPLLLSICKQGRDSIKALLVEAGVKKIGHRERLIVALGEMLD